MKTASESFSNFFTSNSGIQTLSDNTAFSTLTVNMIDYSTTESLTESTSIDSDSIFDKPTNVIARSTVAGVAAAGAVGTGAFALASKRCNTVGYGNKERYFYQSYFR